MKHTPTPPYNVGNRIFDAEKRETAVATKAHPALRVNAAERAAEIVTACNSYEKHVQQIQHLDSAVRAQAATITRLNKERETLYGALVGIKNEMAACIKPFAPEVRAAISNTNYQCLMLRSQKVDDAIALCEGGAE